MRHRKTHRRLFVLQLHDRIEPIPIGPIGKTKGTVEATVTIQSDGKTHVYKAEDVEFSIGGIEVDLTGIGVQAIEDDDP